MKLITLLLCFLLLQVNAQRTWFVAVDGQPGNTGEISSPLDLSTALSETSGVAPGDTILMRGGKYRIPIANGLDGTESNYITVKPYNYEPVYWVGGTYSDNDRGIFHDHGSYCIFRDIIIIDELPERMTQTTGSWPDDLPHPHGIYGEGWGCKYINIIIYDVCGNGFGSWWLNAGCEIYGNIIGNNGWWAPDRGHGHGLYIQNMEGNPAKNVKNNIFFNNHAYNFKAYGESGRMHDIHFYDNISFNAGYPADYGGVNAEAGGSGGGPSNITISRTYAYTGKNVQGGGMMFGYTGDGKNLKVTNNICYGGGNTLCLRERISISTKRPTRAPLRSGKHFVPISLPRIPTSWADLRRIS